MLINKFVLAIFWGPRAEVMGAEGRVTQAPQKSINYFICLEVFSRKVVLNINLQVFIKKEALAQIRVWWELRKNFDKTFLIYKDLFR